MPPKKPVFDVEKARSTIAKGRRSRWIRRKGTMRSGFHYVDADGVRVKKGDQIDRIKALVIPPAWKYVRISPTAGSRLQAVGMDTTGRVQYLYHPKFTARQQRKKYSKIEEFGKFLPSLRTVTNEHISLDGFPRSKVLAVMVRLITDLYFRVGTEKSAKHYRTYGITTLQNKHLKFGRKGTLIFEFVGKSHVKHRKVLVDEELTAVMKKLQRLGGSRKLFHYLDEEGKARPIKPSDLNRYIKEATDPVYSSKDLRTWGGTLLAATELAEIGAAEDEAGAKKNIVKAIRCVAKQLGNTPTVCRSSYIHPAVLTRYAAGVTLEQFRPRKARSIRRIAKEYEPEELALLKLLQARS